ncbi:MAG: hypothetical protein CMD65_02115 [Gammaproteobacteria bacterium]|nr:hypothetical protein [Gammaproteobacteria bacterium]|tara:strand:+ start:3790 stop:4488 length:699 start_codon:yes stop_codon:yes gene_type:complete
MKKTLYDLKQLPIDYSFTINKNFDNFIAENNQFLVDKLITFTKSISDEKSIILLQGDKSSGKTHLCEAIKNYDNKITILINEDYLKFSTQEDYDILIIDNLDRLIINQNNEEYLFSLINEAILNSKSILVTTTKNIEDIKFTIPDLKSRLKWDLIFKINDLNDINKIRVLEKLAGDRGFNLTTKVSNFIMKNYRRDLFFLCNAIKTIDYNSLSEKNNITIPFVKKIMEYKNN